MKYHQSVGQRAKVMVAEDPLLYEEDCLAEVMSRTVALS